MTAQPTAQPKTHVAALAGLFRQALADQQAGRTQQATAACGRILALQPDHADALHLLALISHHTGRPRHAEVLLRRAIAADAAQPQHHHLLGLVLCELGRPSEAAACQRQALQLRPDDPAALIGLGGALCAQGRPAEAAASFEAALRLRPDDPHALNGRGAALFALGRAADAVASYRAALRLRPAFVEALNNLGTALFALARPAAAAAAYQAALRLRPAYPSALNNLGNALCALGRLAEAEAHYAKALRLDPRLPDAHRNLGLVQSTLGRFGEAEANYREALRLQPDHAVTHVNRSMALLLAGQFAEGWREYEWRWRTIYMADGVRDFAAPQWRGEALDGRVLLLHAEQGLGDTLQFCRYAPLAAAAGGRVILEVQAPLVRLLSRLPGVAAVIARGEALPPFDLHCPLLSLPLAFGTTLATIPGTVPYLTADPVDAAAWQRRLAGLQGLRVGLAWAGRSRSQFAELAATDARRSMALQALAPLAGVAGVSFVSLQKGAPAAQTAQPPPGLTLTDPTADLHDFADTAALIAGLDLVVSVDTSVAHLAAALGKPVWLLNRFDTCWRWLHGRDDSPWYPTLQQFRQPAPGDWASVVARVSEALGRLATAPAPSADPAALFGRACAHHQAGRLREAEAACRAVLAVRPRHAEALHLLGLIAHQSRQFGEAARLLRAAIAADGSRPAYHRHLGLVLSDHGQPAEAAASLRTALQLRPDYPEAHHSLGLALAALGQPAAAEASFRAALRLRSAFPAALNARAVALLALARPAEAEAACREALALRPDDADAHNTLASALFAQQRPDEAEACLRQALRLRPQFAAALLNLGNVLTALGRPDAAEASYREALRLAPAAADLHAALGRLLLRRGRSAEAEACHRTALVLQPGTAARLTELGEALHAQGRFAEAQASFAAALRLRPDDPTIRDRLGSVLYARGRPAAAAASHRAALQRDPGFADALGNLGRALSALGRPAEADARYRALLQLRPDDAEGHTHRGMALLLDGQFAEGWREYEWRWQTRYMAAGRRDFAAPRWPGKTPDGAAPVLLLHAEQGLGDTLQFCRYAPLLAPRARVMLEVQPALVRLLSRLPGVAAVLARGAALPAFDLHCPLLSLPLAVGTTLATIPAAVPYLTADPAAAADWRRRLAPLPGLRVGLVWAGQSHGHAAGDFGAVDARRSLALHRLAPLGAVAGVSFVSLQKGPPADQAAAPPPGLALTDLTAELHDMADTAALIAALDLVIGVDTAVVHLAGALGKPVWLLNRFDTCWRWLRHRNDSPWYPTLRQFRQPRPGDWGSVIASVQAELRRLWLPVREDHCRRRQQSAVDDGASNG